MIGKNIKYGAFTQANFLWDHQLEISPCTKETGPFFETSETFDMLIRGLCRNGHQQLAPTMGQ